MNVDLDIILYIKLKVQ